MPEQRCQTGRGHSFSSGSTRGPGGTRPTPFYPVPSRPAAQCSGALRSTARPGPIPPRLRLPAAPGLFASREEAAGRREAGKVRALPGPREGPTAQREPPESRRSPSPSSAGPQPKLCPSVSSLYIAAPLSRLPSLFHQPDPTTVTPRISPSTQMNGDGL